MSENKFNRFGVMIDNSRNAVMNVSAVKKYIDLISDMGYDFLMLYTEDTYECDGQPYFGHLRGGFKKSEIKELDAYAKDNGVQLFPCIQTLAHLNALMQWPIYLGMRDTGDILLAGDERVYHLIDDMFYTLSQCYTSRIVNVGMDEAFSLGRGTYEDLHGAVPKKEILLTHLSKVSEIAAKYGFSLLVWGDMFYNLLDGNNAGDIAGLIPENVTLINWDYHKRTPEEFNTKFNNYKSIDNNTWFAGGLWSWTGFAPHLSYGLEAAEASVKGCIENGVRNCFFTIWGDNGGETSRFSILPSLFAASEFAKGNFDKEKIKADFKNKFGMDFDRFMLLELPDTPNKNGASNPEKYLLYSDPFMGRFDSTLTGNEGELYGKCAEKLEMPSDDGEYSLIFKSMAALARVLELKAGFGNNVRKAYLSGDMKGLSDMIPVCDEIISRLEKFYDAFEKQWMWENKPHGFDVQDIRIGGLIMRMKHAKKQLERYAHGEIDRLEELEEPVKNPFCYADETKSSYCFNSWSTVASANVL